MGSHCRLFRKKRPGPNESCYWSEIGVVSKGASVPGEKERGGGLPFITPGDPSHMRAPRPAISPGSGPLILRLTRRSLPSPPLLCFRLGFPPFDPPGDPRILSPVSSPTRHISPAYDPFLLRVARRLSPLAFPCFVSHHGVALLATHPLFLRATPRILVSSLPCFAAHLS